MDRLCWILISFLAIKKNKIACKDLSPLSIGSIPGYKDCLKISPSIFHCIPAL